MISEAQRAFLSSQIGQSMVVEVAGLFANYAIPLMPLKGVLMQQTLYRESVDRQTTDVDILIAESDWRSAREVLRSDGWQRSDFKQCPWSSEEIWRNPRFPLVLDLHRRLFAWGRFPRLTTKVLFERAETNTALFGVAISRMHPLDVFAHRLGHYFWNRTFQNPSWELTELELMARYDSLQVDQVAAHLRLYGLARALVYVSLWCSPTLCPFIHGVASQLIVTDGLGFALAQGVAMLSKTRGPYRKLGWMAQRVLHEPIQYIPLIVAESMARAPFE